MKNYNVRNRIVSKTSETTIQKLINLLTDGKLITIPHFLQRTLLKEKWFKNNYQNSKQYNISLFKGQGKLDSITIVPIDLLIKKLEETISSENNKNVKKSLEVGLELLNDFKSNGAVLVNLDGQSRTILGILEYAVKNTYSLGEDASSIILDMETKDGSSESSELVHNKFNELSVNLQNIYKNEILVTNLITDFYEFNDIVDTLVNKQKGFSWVEFQIEKQKNRFTEFVVNLVDIFKTKQGELYSTYWDNNMKSLKSDFKSDVDGHHLFSIMGGYLMERGSYINDTDAIKQLSSKEPIKKKSIIDFINIVNTSFFNCLGDTKVTLPVLINFLVFKMVLKNGRKKGTTSFTQNIRIPKDVIILNNVKLLDMFMQLHLTLTATVGKNGSSPHSASWINDDGTWIVKTNGYKNLCTQQKDDYIIGRMKLFFENLDWETMVNEKVVKLVNDNRKKSKEDVLVFNGFEDILGKTIPTSEFTNTDRSHYESTDNGGSWEHTNLGLEHYSTNRSRGPENLEKIPKN